MKHKYSVLMSLYSKERPEYLRQALQSMVDQTLSPDEIVIVKDGSITCELQQVLDVFLSRYPMVFKVIGYEENRGLGYALNYGLIHCKNEFVARMDTDDISKLNRCERQVEMFILHPELAIVGSFVDEFSVSTENTTGRRIVPVEHADIYEFAKRRSAFNHPSVMYRKSKVMEFGGYRDLRRNQDVDLFGRMLFGGCRAINIAESLLWFRSDISLSRRRKSWENTKSYIDTIKKFWKIGFASFGDYLVVAIGQMFIFIMPIAIQNWLYKTFLRA